MNKKKKGKGISGLQWYREVCKFLTELDCYLTTPVMDRTIFDELLNFAQKNTYFCMKMLRIPMLIPFCIMNYYIGRQI